MSQDEKPISPTSASDSQNTDDAAKMEQFHLQQLNELPDNPVAHNSYALFLANQQRAREAATHYEQALQLLPEYPEALRNYANLLVAERKFDRAIGLLWSAVRIRPDDVPALNALGNALVNAKRPEEAIPLLRHAIRLLPRDGRLHANLGLAYCDCGRFSDAEAAFLEALRIETMSVMAHNNLACLYIMMGRHREALSCLELALILEPRHENARRNRALAQLALGEFERGWDDYDWYAFGVPQPPDPFPRWNGQPLAGQRILLTARQGLGDTLHFIRYAIALKSLGAHIIFECPPPLLEVLAHVEGIDEFVPQGESLPHADLCVPLMALARIFKTTLATIPDRVPYVTAAADNVARWRARLDTLADPTKIRVGICWQGNPHHQWDRFRSGPLMQFEPLARIDGVRLVSLQRGPGIEQISTFQRLTNNALVVPTDGRQDGPGDLADSAAIMSVLDLIITVDTATAHLAGALARPVWVTIAQAADWRWLTQRSDSPWYPTMRLFRQQHVGEWEPVFAELALHLAALARPRP